MGIRTSNRRRSWTFRNTALQRIQFALASLRAETITSITQQQQQQQQHYQLAPSVEETEIVNDSSHSCCCCSVSSTSSSTTASTTTTTTTTTKSLRKVVTTYSRQSSLCSTISNNTTSSTLSDYSDTTTAIDMMQDTIDREEEEENNNNSSSTDSSSSSSNHDLGELINVMQDSQLCVHPIHKHSFSHRPFNAALLVASAAFVGTTTKTCPGCEQPLVGGGGTTTSFFQFAFGGNSQDKNIKNDQIVKCMACGVYAHRSCAFATTTTNQDDGSPLWKTKCHVNLQKLEQQEKKEEGVLEDGLVQIEPTITITTGNDIYFDTSPDVAHQDEVVSLLANPSEEEEDDDDEDKHDAIMASLQSDRDRHNNKEGDEEEDNNEESASTISSAPPSDHSSSSLLERLSFGLIKAESPTSPKSKEKFNDEMVWTSDGPPQHWANTMTSPIKQSGDKSDNDEENNDNNNNNVDIANSSFGSVALALQENILTHFKQKMRRLSLSSLSEISADMSSLEDELDNKQQVRQNSSLDDNNDNNNQDVDSNSNRSSPIMMVDTRALLNEVKPKQPEKKRSQLGKVIDGTIKVSKASAKIRRKIGLASVTGGIVGGVAGLCMGGPAGAVLGAKLAQTAGVLSVVLEGSVTVGILVAGAAAGSYTARQLEEQHQQRILAIGEEGIRQKLVLVRPNICIDPKWTELCAQAKRDAPVFQTSNDTNSGLFSSVLSLSPARQAEAAQAQRSERDKDIVHTDEQELPTMEKIMVLVSRILNDKLSLPGYVYRRLVGEYFKRSDERLIMAQQQSDNDGDDENVNNLRLKRQDCHAVIKHVTATLLEVRPGFESVPEMTATAVEGLVFGELYRSVMEEIKDEMRAVDEALITKMMEFDSRHHHHYGGWDDDDSIISPDALVTLSQVPLAISPVDKLRHCVSFLENVSQHFSKSQQRSAMGADCLLKMVCQHLLVAKVPYVNAEIAFLEEFARDERLLRGKEGYALVTLQASLHFLNASNDFDEDIFAN